MINSATKTFPKPMHKPKITHKLPCYTNATRRARQDYHRAKNKNNKLRNTENSEALKTKSKAYKKELAKTIAISNKKLAKQLRNLKDKNPKQYWKILQGNKKENINIATETLKEHFENLAVELGDIENLPPQDNANVRELDTSALNQSFTETEIRNFVKNLKNNKAAGIDRILNEFIKHSIDIMIPLYIKLFNRVLDKGEIPDDWLTGIIIPIYKNKGSREDANNYRGITLLSCLGKLFTSILNHRLTNFCEENNILKENQTGFRKGYSTLDHIYVLRNVIELFKFKKKKLFCCFVDYTKAFDSVWREAL